MTTRTILYAPDNAETIFKNVEAWIADTLGYEAPRKTIFYKSKYADIVVHEFYLTFCFDLKTSGDTVLLRMMFSDYLYELPEADAERFAFEFMPDEWKTK